VKLLLDTCVWGGAQSELQSRGHDVIWSGNWEEDPGDDEILAFAFKEGRILVTLDKDFGELAIVRGSPHSGIIRIVGIAARQQSTVCDQVLTLYGDELQAGAILTVEPGRIRLRSPDQSM
jgi:predicted nuclease of predicted toxin-antitoxin system